MTDDIKYIIYLKSLVDHLSIIIKKIEKQKEIDDDDRDVIKATIQAFLNMEKELE